MITMFKGNAQNAETYRLILSCDQCQSRVEMDVPLDNIRDHGDMATEPYVEQIRLELAQSCPHMQAALERHGQEAQPSAQGRWNTPQRRPSSYTDHS